MVFGAVLFYAKSDSLSFFLFIRCEMKKYAYVLIVVLATDVLSRLIFTFSSLKATAGTPLTLFTKKDENR